MIVWCSDGLCARVEGVPVWVATVSVTLRSRPLRGLSCPEG